MRVRWTPQAEQDIEEVHQFVARDSLKAADGLIDKLYTTALRLGQFPKLGKGGCVKGTRDLVVPGTPFYLSYRVVDEGIHILAVVHGARRRPPARA
jgi:toxin ParE1/3/4